MLLEATAAQTIIREISADLETPISVYMKLRGETPSFLLEAVEGGERIARYSFIGVQPRAEYILRNDEIEIKDEHGSRVIKVAGDPTRFLQNEMDRFPAVRVPNAPRFTGGLVGLSDIGVPLLGEDYRPDSLVRKRLRNRRRHPKTTGQSVAPRPNSVGSQAFGVTSRRLRKRRATVRNGQAGCLKRSTHGVFPIAVDEPPPELLRRQTHEVEDAGMVEEIQSVCERRDFIDEVVIVAIVAGAAEVRNVIAALRAPLGEGVQLLRIESDRQGAQDFENARRKRRLFGRRKLGSRPTPVTGTQEYFAPYNANRGLSAMPPSVRIQTLSPRCLIAPTR